MLRNPECLDDEYRTKLDALVDESEDLSYAAAESVFVDRCESLREPFKNDTPVDVIQRVAFSITASHFRYK